ncbi:hypothetical protein K4F52_009136 [Lecanicillium sp. MT-2017a]|nr:hypothetical protein K4F52_009136 [Lecanicillium sp. MT-2017a]
MVVVESTPHLSAVSGEASGDNEPLKNRLRPRKLSDDSRKMGEMTFIFSPEEFADSSPPKKKKAKKRAGTAASKSNVSNQPSFTTQPEGTSQYQ